MQRPVRVPQHLARERDEIRVAVAHDRVRLRRIADQPDGHGRHVRLGAHAPRERHLEPGTARHQMRLRRQVHAARRAVDHVHAGLAQPAGERDRVVQRPADADAVDRRQAEAQWPVRGPRLAHRGHDGERQPHAPVAVAAPAIAARVRQRRQERVQQVAMRRVDLDDVEAGGERAPRGRAVVVEQPPDVVVGHRVRRRVALAPAARRRALGAPRRLAARAVGVGQRTEAVPRRLRRRLAPGMLQLDARGGAGFVQQRREPPERGDVRVVPQPVVVPRAARPRRDRGRLDHHQRRAAEREAAEVREVPVADAAVARRVHLHRRHDDAVAQRGAAQRERREQRGVRRHASPSGGRARRHRRLRARAAPRPCAGRAPAARACTRPASR